MISYITSIVLSQSRTCCAQITRNVAYLLCFKLESHTQTSNSTYSLTESHILTYLLTYLLFSCNGLRRRTVDRYASAGSYL